MSVRPKSKEIYKWETKMLDFIKTEKHKLSKEAKLAILLQAFNVQTLGLYIQTLGLYIKPWKPNSPIFSSQRRKMQKLVLVYNHFTLS